MSEIDGPQRRYEDRAIPQQENGAMFRSLLLVSGAILVTGCVSVQHVPMSGAAVEDIKGKQLALAERPRPDFAATTAAKAAFGLIGAAAMISAGNEIVKHNGIQDPAVYIGERLAAELGTRYSVQRSPKGVPIVTDSAADMAGSGFGSDLVLDVRTLNWSFAYFPTSWTRYRVIYSARLRLLNGKTGQVLAEGGCFRAPQETPASPSYDELLANSAERLKQELRTVADSCVEEFRSKTLAL